MALKIFNDKNRTMGLEAPFYIPEGIFEVTENGTFNVSDYEYVKVLVETGNQPSQLSLHEKDSFFLSDEGVLWGTGEGRKYGQMGTGDLRDFIQFTPLITNVKTFQAPERSTWVLKKDGTLWGCGLGTYGQQGDGFEGGGRWTENQYIIPFFAQRLTNVKSISCSTHTTWAIKKDGTLWGCGRGDLGQQGSGENNHVDQFTQRMENVSKVACSNEVTWALKKDGTLWGCGVNNYGQQGNGERGGSVNEFTQRMDNVKDIILSISSFTTNYNDTSCSVTWVLKNDGTLWSCGLNEGYVQGFEGSSYALTFAQRMSNVKTFNAGDSTSWILKNDGTLWSCGNAGYGVQGISYHTDVREFTQRISDVKKVKCSGRTTWVIKNDNTLWGTGAGDYGMQGNDGNDDVYEFTQRLTDVKDVGCSRFTTFAVKKDGTLWGCGRGDYGQQGNGETYNVYTFTQKTL